MPEWGGGEWGVWPGLSGGEVENIFSCLRGPDDLCGGSVSNSPRSPHL